MGKVKKTKKGGSGILRSVVGAVSPRAGKALELASNIRGKVAGRGKQASTGVRRRSRGFNINKYAKKLIKAKLDARLMKEKLKVINSIR